MNRSSEGIKRLVDERFDGNMNTCSRVLNVTPSTISRVIKGSRNAGSKLIYSVIDYCYKRDLDYRKYIF